MELSHYIFVRSTKAMTEDIVNKTYFGKVEKQYDDACTVGEDTVDELIAEYDGKFIIVNIEIIPVGEIN